MVLSSVTSGLGSTTVNIIKAVTYTGIVIKGTSRAVRHQAEKVAHFAKESFQRIGRYALHIATSTKESASRTLNRVRAHSVSKKPEVLND